MRSIFLASYDPSWKFQCKKEIAKLHEAFQGLPIFFHHIGSTSIPGCKAKPILDILGIVSDVVAVDSYNSELEEMGYMPKGEFGMRRRRYFDREGEPGVHLHIFEDTDPEVDRQLRFRDYLDAHPDQIKSYSDLKEQLITKYAHDRDKYCLEKTPFIKKIDRLAALEGKPSIRKWGSKRSTLDQRADPRCNGSQYAASYDLLCQICSHTRNHLRTRCHSRPCTNARGYF